MSYINNTIGFAKIPLFVAIVLLSTILSACSIYSEPNPDCVPECNVTLQLDFSHDFPLYDHFVFSRSDTDSPIAVRRFIVNAYPILSNGQLDTSSYKHIVVDGSSYPVDDTVYLNVELPCRYCRVYVWEDYGDENLKDLYYDTTDFANISFIGEYSGNNEKRIVFVGNTDVDLSSLVEGSKTTVPILLSSPMARIEIRTNDLEHFIADVNSRYNSRTDIDKVIVIDPDDIQDDNKFSADDFIIYVRYVSYFPSVYSVFDGKPVDASVNIGFESKIYPLNDKDALLGFDYIYVNGDISSITAVIDVYEKNPDGSIGANLGSSPSISIPIAVGMETTVESDFLTTHGSGNVSIDPSYDDDVYIYWN